MSGRHAIYKPLAPCRCTVYKHPPSFHYFATASFLRLLAKMLRFYQDILNILL